MGDVCHSTFGYVPFIRKFSDVIVLLIPSISHYNCFLCYRRVFLMCRLSAQKIQRQQNDKAGSFRNQRLYAVYVICGIVRWYCLLEVVPVD